VFEREAMARGAMFLTASTPTLGLCGFAVKSRDGERVRAHVGPAELANAMRRPNQAAHTGGLMTEPVTVRIFSDYV